MFNKRSVLIFAIALLTVFTANAPIFFGYLNRPEGTRFTSCGRDDEYVYLAWVRQAKEGRWLFDNPYTLEKHSRLYPNPVFLTLGKLAGLFGIDSFLAFNFGRIFFGLILLLVVWVFINYFVRDRFWQFFAFLLVCFSGGLGFLAAFPAKLPSLQKHLWASYSVTEGLTFPSLLFYPQTTVSVSLMLAFFLIFLENLKRKKFRILILSSFLGNFLILIHPYDVVLLVVVPLFFLLSQRTIDKKKWFVFGSSVLFLSPASLYLFTLSRIDPVYRAWSRIYQLSPSPTQFFMMYGLLLIFMAMGLFFGREKLKEKFNKANFSFLITWVLILPFLLKAPLPFQRRLIEGAHIPISILAAYGLFLILQKTRGKSRPFILFLILISLVPQNIYYLKRRIDILRKNQDGLYFLSEEKIKAYFWLFENSESDDAVLALPNDGLVIPALSTNRVFLGHWANTVNSGLKARILFSFFSPETFDTERIAFLKREGIKYFFYSKDSPLLKRTFDPWEKEYLGVVFENSRVAIFKARFYK